MEDVHSNILDKLESKTEIEIKIEEVKNVSRLEKSLKNVFKRLDCFLQRAEDDDSEAKIVVFGKVDEKMYDDLDDKMGDIAKWKRKVYLDIARGPVSADSIWKIGFKKLFGKDVKDVKEYEPKKKEKMSKEAFYV